MSVLEDLRLEYLDRVLDALGRLRNQVEAAAQRFQKDAGGAGPDAFEKAGAAAAAGLHVGPHDDAAETRLEAVHCGLAAEADSLDEVAGLLGEQLLLPRTQVVFVDHCHEQQFGHLACY